MQRTSRSSFGTKFHSLIGKKPYTNEIIIPRNPAGATAHDFYLEARRSGPLAAAGPLSGHDLQLRSGVGYEGSFDHQLTGMPLRVLATVVVRDGRAFVVTCSAPPEAFETLLPRFRAIAASFDLGAGAAP